MHQYHKVHSQACYLLLFYIWLHGHGRPLLLLPGGGTCLINQNHLVAGSLIWNYLTIAANEDGKDVHILVIINYITQHAQATVTSSQTVKCTAQNVWDKFIVHYGLPEKILTDQGHNFESDLLWELWELAQVKKIRTLGYHPQTNGQCEHFNTTLINMVGTLPEMPKSTWREQLPTLVHAYDGTRNNVTDFSPYYLMFGGKPCLLIDILFGSNTAKLKDNTSTKYVENLKWRLEWAYKTANKVVKKEQEWNKQYYHHKIRCAKLEVGDKVLLKCTAFKGKHKIQDRWKNTIYEVVKQPIHKMAVFKIESMEGDGKMKVVHQNVLLPLFSDPSDHTNTSDTESVVDQTVNMHGVITASAVISHVQDMGAYNKAWVADVL